ncbi:hypothetical protein HK098_006312 [Nowakowskiella sp. JEL0407]|nr:hypothetical protein HK098_006312 [Nowakowskiella sp. JEL0407]
MKVICTFEQSLLRLTFPTLESFLALKFSGKIEIPYTAISKLVIQPPEAFNFIKGVKVGYRGIQDAAATYYHFDGTGPEFHLYSNPEKTVGFVISNPIDSKNVGYDKIVVEIDGDLHEFANLLSMTVLDKTGVQVVIVSPESEKIPLVETEKKTA